MRLSWLRDERVYVSVLVGALIAIGVFGVWAGSHMDVRTGKLALLELGLLCGAACLIRPLSARMFALWVVFGVLVVYDWRSIITCWRIILALLAVQVIRSRLSKEGVPGVLNAWRVVTILHTAYMLVYQAVGFDPIFNPILDRSVTMVGFMDNTTIAGAYTAMTIPLFFRGRWKWYVPAGLFATYLTGSTGALVVACSLICLQVFHWALAGRKRRLLAVLALAGICCAAVGPGLTKKIEGEKSARVLVWKEAMRQLEEKPVRLLTGFGPGQFGREFRERFELRHKFLRWEVAHSEPIQGLYEFGLIGMSWILLFIFWILNQARRDRDEVTRLFCLTALGWFMVSIFTFSAHHAALAMVLLMSIAMIGVPTKEVFNAAR